MARTAQLVSFCGKFIETTVTNKASEAENWMHDSMSKYTDQKIIVGFNCKWRPHPIPSLSSKLATLQLCTDTECLILQLLYMDSISETMKNFFGDSNIIFVGIEVKETLLKLETEYGLCFKYKIDVRALAKMNFPLSFSENAGLKALALHIVQLQSWKPKNLSLNCGMEARILGVEQVKFACVDAYVCYRIGHRLLKEI
ncbi:hypothetical protein HS088_TW06G00112 [Tripterygium wilfordii]|uniref:3'-5' exonuclease domain-containing protein n=1 Tax=Tripterygium wilfordii TaxID=458696 RepID=A0A7J7DHW9_TRIWF|nr:Werner syndrome ATP-dependent helicase homolog [Tripterygium wilfordii]KAF5745947.1 hypothetical protein HS088_TW06G00112 [Tripterygium wilfordii]